MSTDPQARLTAAARAVWDKSLREALALGHNYIGTEHILLALMRERDTLAARVLMGLGLTEEKVRNAVIQALRQSPPTKLDEARVREIVRQELDARG